MKIREATKIKGLQVAQLDDSKVYIIEGKVISKCSRTCNWDHDHYDEDHVTVKYETRTAIPVSKLKCYFDILGIGHNFEDQKKRDSKCLYPSGY